MGNATMPAENASPTEKLGFSDWIAILWRVKDRISEDNVSIIAGGIAFYGILALFPAITALVAIGGLVMDPTTIVDQAEDMAELLPPEAASIILSQMEEVAGADSSGLGLAAILGTLLALWSSSKGVGTMMQGLNVAYSEKETRGFIKLKLVVLALTVSIIFGVLMTFLIIAILPIVLAFGDDIPVISTILSFAQWPVLAAIGISGIGLLYRYGPSRVRPRWRWLAPGAVTAWILWIGATVGFAIYVRYSGSYNETFGALAGVIILLMWLWISAFILLLGAEIDAEAEAQTKADTTVGAAKPLGQRGAEKADAYAG